MGCQYGYRLPSGHGAYCAVAGLQEGTKNILRSSGVDVDSISAQANTASKTIQDASVKATPFVTKVTNFLTTSSPETLAKVAIVLVLAYYLTPFALKAAVSSLRGYAGTILFSGPGPFHPVHTNVHCL